MTHSDQRRQSRFVEQLFVKHVSSIRGYIEAFVPDFNRAEDVLQECFLTVAAKADRFRADEDSDFLAWALTIAKYKVLESVRRSGATIGSLSPEVIEVLSVKASAEAPADDARSLLQECMEELSPRAREAIDLRYGEACKPAEIARRMQWTPQSVYVTLSRARSLLRECIERRAKRQEHR